MLESMRRLHPRGAANRGICVDAEGATLGPDCTLVCRDSSGYPTVDRDTASDLQKCVLDIDRDRDWLFQQCRRIADALNKGEVALAQVYGLHIPIGDLDDRTLRRIAAVELAKGGFKPDEPRLPKGGPHGGEWTSGGDGGDNDSGQSAPIALDSTTVETPAPASAPTSSEGPIKWEFKPPTAAPVTAGGGDGRAMPSAEPPTTLGSPDFSPDVPVGSDPDPGTGNPLLDVPGIDAIDPDYSLENLMLFFLGTGSAGRLSRLARALIRLGISRDGDVDTHHIVASLAQRADPARKILRRFSIDLDDPANGVFLPRTQHRELHTNPYYDAVNEALAGAKTKSEAIQLLRSIAHRLGEGRFP